MNDPLVRQLRSTDGREPRDPALLQAAQGGVLDIGGQLADGDAAVDCLGCPIFRHGGDQFADLDCFITLDNLDRALSVPHGQFERGLQVGMRERFTTDQ